MLITEKEKMKAAILKIVKRQQPTQNRVPVTIEDTLPPPINAVAGEPIRAGSSRHLDVDAVLARSLPKVAGE
jgi:hypothetical protein